MKLVVLTSRSCLPCERAYKEVSRLIERRPDLAVEHAVRPDPSFATYKVVYTPTVILVAEGEEVSRLSGAHQVKLLELEGMIDDFLTSQAT